MEGQIIGGRFEIVRKIGQGGMGTVYEARHKTLPRRFAIKILRPELADNAEHVGRFRREAIAAGAIEHPNVIYITDFGTTAQGSLYLVMEYLEGIGLDEVLARNVRLPLSRAIPILAQAADALDAAHKVNVVHRDLKPENIQLTEVRGRKDVVKVLDFGIAHVTRSGEQLALTAKGQVFGTAEYMSPEQALGEKCDGRSDVYALGCLAYELITGDPPFTGQPVRILQAHVSKPVAPPSTQLHDHPIPPAVDALVLRCLAKDPRDRYQTGAELRHDLLKVRGLLYSLGAEIATGRSRRRALTDEQQTAGWRSLGGDVPELLAGESPMGPPPAASALGITAPHTASGDAVNVESLHHEYHQVLRELGIGLVQAAVAPAEASDLLERLLAVEEEIASLTGAIALSEQNFDRIRFEYSQKEKRLRYAVFELGMERAKIEGQAQAHASDALLWADKLDDLDYQIAALSKRIDEIGRERSAEIQRLAQEVQNYRQVREEREQEASEIYQRIHAEVEAKRPTAEQQDPLRALYVRLDEVRGVLQQARGSVSTS